MMKIKYYLITVLIFAADYITKQIASAKLSTSPRDAYKVISGFLSLSLAENSGVAFGLFDDLQSGWKPYVLAAIAMAAIAVILIYSMHTSRDRKLLQIALAITMGGILGNLVDRISHGFVVDFIDCHINKFHWPTFNIADSAITVGIVLLLIDTVRKQPAVDSGQ
jgi:signal peptidase II